MTHAATLYDPATGQLLASMCGSASDIALFIDGHAHVAGAWSSRTHRVVDGEVIALPPQPSDHHVFDYAVGAWVPDLARADAALRAERNRRLASTDFTQLPDLPEQQRSAWAAYRQALRDLPDQPGWPLDVEWPAQPQ